MIDDDVLKAVAEQVARTVAEHRIPGLALGVVHDQELCWTAGFGKADLKSGREPAADTLWRVASITKTFTATAIMQLRDDGLLRLDDPLVDHLPEFAQVKSRAGDVQAVTIRRLLSHHSGLVTEPPVPCWDAVDFPSREAILAALPNTEIVIPQDSAFKYSNLAFGLLGEAIHRLSGRPYVEYMHAEILRPLGLTSSVFELTDLLRARMAVGYTYSPYADMPSPAPYAPLNGMTACGQLHSSVADLAQWISFQFRTGSVARGGRQVLSGTSLEEMHRPQYLEPDWSLGYCLGWRARRLGQRVYYEHGGGIHGFASQVMFSKPHRIGVIALANVWPSTALYEIPAKIMETLIDRAAGKPPCEASTLCDTPPERLRFLGAYEAQPALWVHVAFRSGELRLEPPAAGAYSLHAPAALEPTDAPNAFIVRSGRGAGERVVFEVDASGNVRSFSLGGFVYRKLLPCPS